MLCVIVCLSVTHLKISVDVLMNFFVQPSGCVYGQDHVWNLWKTIILFSISPTHTHTFTHACNCTHSHIHTYIHTHLCIGLASYSYSYRKGILLICTLYVKIRQSYSAPFKHHSFVFILDYILLPAIWSECGKLVSYI